MEQIGNIISQTTKKFFDKYFRETVGITRRILRQAEKVRKNPKVAFEGKIYRFGYYSYKKKKRSGGFREIFVPHPDLKTLQYCILDFFLQFPAPPVNYGFIKGESYFSAMQFVRKMRQNYPYIFFFDVVDAFPSITRDEITQMLIERKVDKIIAQKLSFYCCTNDRILPQGAPTSPHLLNLVYTPMDWTYIKYAGDEDLFYLRYADNLIFLSKEIAKEPFVKKTISIAEMYSRKIHDPVIIKSAGDIRLLGLNIVGDEIHIPPELKDRFRQILFLASKDSSYWKKANGVIANLSMIYGGELPPRFKKQLQKHPLIRPT